MPLKPVPPEAIQAAKAAHSALRRLGSHGVTAPETPEHWVKIGTEGWENSYKGDATDGLAHKRLLYWVDERVQENPFDQKALYRKLQIQLPDGQCRYLWAARWVDQGCPRIVVEPKYAALLMATDVSKELLEHVIPPWKAVLIEVPADLLVTTDEDGLPDTIRYIMFQTLVSDDGDRLCHMVGIGKKVSLWKHNLPMQDLADNHTGEEREAGNWGTGYEVTSRDDRVIVMMGRLILSTCIALMDSSNYRKQTTSKGRGNRNRTGKGLTEIQSFVLGKPVAINCRQAVLDYIGGATRKGPKVQFIVRGHWKHQAHGPNHSLRKFIPIDPYWKGPEDAKILTRTVELVQTKGST